MRNLLIILVSTMIVIVGCSSQPTVEYDTGTAVPLELVEELQFSDTADLSIDDCVQRFYDVTEPHKLTEDDVLPADFALYIDLDEVYMGWQEFEMQPLCVKGNWGVFRTTGIVEIPVASVAWSITID